MLQQIKKGGPLTVSDISSWILSPWTAALIPLLGVLTACVVISASPASHRERLLWDVPPPTEPPAYRKACLKRNTWRTLRWQSVVIGPSLAAVLGAIAVIGLIQAHAPLGIGITIVGIVVALSVVYVDVLGALILLSRYASAAKRIRLDAENQGHQQLE